MEIATGQPAEGWTEGWRSRAGQNTSTHQPKSPIYDVEEEEDVAHFSRSKGLPDSILFATLEHIGCGYLVLDDRRTVVQSNAMARELLQEETGVLGPRADEFSLSSAFRRLLDRAGARFPFAPVPWVAVPRETRHPLILNQIANIIRDGCVVVVMLDLDARPEPNPHTLQRMFGLTAAETRLALRLIRGEAPGDVAREQRLRMTTVRSHLASLFAKTQTGRQAELVALLCRVAIMP